MEIPGGWAFKEKVPSVGGEMNIFWNYIMFSKCVFDNMGTEFSCSEILQEPEVREDHLHF